jgi:hypothetical protein
MKLAGNSWATLDTFSQRTEIRGFFPDGTGALNAFVVDHTLQTAALVKHNGTNWIPVNTTAIPYVPNGYSFMIEDTMGHFYIAHSNGTNSGIRVMKYTPRPTTAVKGNIHPGGVSISPIPASQSIWIQSNDPALNGRQATITDIQGRRVYQFTLSASQVIDIQQWSPGIYCLRLPDGSVLKMMKAN